MSDPVSVEHRTKFIVILQHQNADAATQVLRHMFDTGAEDLQLLAAYLDWFNEIALSSVRDVGGPVRDAVIREMVRVLSSVDLHQWHQHTTDAAPGDPNSTEGAPGEHVPRLPRGPCPVKWCAQIGKTCGSTSADAVNHPCCFMR